MRPSAQAMEVPPGFAPWPARSPFVDGVAGIFVAGTSESPVFGVRVHETHCNGLGSAHGGFISTLADVWSAYSLAPRLDPTARFSTSSLAVEFLSRVQAGDWLQSEMDRIRIGRRICVVTLAIVCDQRPVALAKASFSLADA
jgi:acyl-coenzyme A thioesterase 13